MVAPYREARIPERELDVSDEPQPLAEFDVGGRKGADGAHGHPGQSAFTTGGHGHRGGDAGPASPGEGAGAIRIELAGDDDTHAVKIEGELVARGERRAVRDLVMIDETGFIALRAIGGDGGRGGNGGHGGDGARGANGADATRWSSGSDGGDGGSGGDGGNATSGAAGGPGGRIDVTVREEDTPLLMLLRHDVRGGAGGPPGMNGSGGSGGAGGDGGDSYSWTETEYYTDSNGNRQSRTHWHSNSGGSDGSPGRSGSPGRARVKRGADGDAGRFQIHVRSGDSIATYTSRYDLRLVAFAHDSLNEDAVYEPNELVRVFDLEVENVGGMPTPAKDKLALALQPGGWVKPEPGELACMPGLAAGERYRVPGELVFRIKDFVPAEPSDPLEVEETILQRAMLPSVRRGFDAYQTADATEQGRFVIRFPLRVSPVQHLRSLAAGEATRVRFTVTNQSRFALGAASPAKRVIRVRVATAADSELGDEHVRFVVDGRELTPRAGWTHELAELGAGESADLELTVRLSDTAPEYLMFAAHVTLELGAIEAPETTRPIQLRGFEIRVARPFAVSDADLLLVVNHRTSREAIEGWEQLADQLACKLAIWDLSREGHLDLERPLSDGIALAQWFANKAIVILDNAIEDGAAHPHVYLDEAQATRAAANGLDVAIVGKGCALPRLLLPEADEAFVHEVHKSFWVRWWAKPSEEWLAKQALEYSLQLAAERPAERHLVVYRFAPKLDGKSAWVNRWRAGTLETVRMLDTACAAVVHAAATDEQLGDPAFITGDHVRTALLVMFGFEENLARLHRLLRRPDVTTAELQPVLDALALDLANEVLAAIAPGWMGDTAAVELPLPCLDALARHAFAVDYDSTGGAAVRLFLARVVFLADSQVRWWETLPPLRWFRRSTTARTRIAQQLAHAIAAMFDTRADAAHADIARLVKQLVAEHKAARKASYIAKRRSWSVEQARLPIAPQSITCDTELLATAVERVMPAAEYDAIVAAKVADRAERAELLASAAQQHAELLVPKSDR